MLIWGTGCLTAEVIGKYINSDKIEGFIDNNPNIHEFMVGGS